MTKPLVLGSLFHGLYCTTQHSTVDAPPQPHTSLVSHANNKLTSSMLWHLRLDHAPPHTLQLLCPHIDVKHFKQDIICTICLMAKQHRLSFSSSSIKTVAPFQLLHLDVWGPYAHPTYDSCSYFLTIVDDYTRCT